MVVEEAKILNKKILITDIHIPYISTNNNKYLTAWNKLYKEEKDFKIENNLKSDWKIERISKRGSGISSLSR